MFFKSKNKEIQNSADKTEVKNASQFPEIFYARHMESGLAEYDGEKILVSTDAIKNMMPSFKGKPLYVFHKTKADHLEDLKQEAHGYVLDTFYNEVDGWVWSKVLVIDDVAHEAIAKGWAVSNSYIPTEYGNGGTHHGCEYGQEIINGEYTHLAIVPNPRYEGACIMSETDYKIYCESKEAHLKELQNSTNSTKETGKMKFFKREKKEVTEIDAETLVEITNDDGTVSEVSVQDMITAETERQNAKKNEADDKEKVNDDSEIDVNGETMTVGELKNRYAAGKKNADEEKDNTSDEDDKKNADKDEEKDNEDDKDEKKNSNDKDHFKELSNAHRVTGTPAKPYMKIDGLATGKAKY